MKNRLGQRSCNCAGVALTEIESYLYRACICVLSSLPLSFSSNSIPFSVRSPCVTCRESRGKSCFSKPGFLSIRHTPYAIRHTGLYGLWRMDYPPYGEISHIWHPEI